jgi:hypothetical protein
MLNYIAQATQSPWIMVYLRILAVALAYSAIIHAGNMLGLSGTPWFETPLAWRAGDVTYLLLDLAAAIGLWQLKPWGLGLLLLAVGSQFVIYTVFIDLFAQTADQRQTIYGLLGTEAIAVLVLAVMVGIWSVTTTQKPG